MPEPTDDQVLKVWLKYLTVEEVAKHFGWGWHRAERRLAKIDGVDRDRSFRRGEERRKQRDWQEPVLPEASNDEVADELMALLRAQKKDAAISLLEAANVLNCSPNRVETAAEVARANGFAVTFRDESLRLNRTPEVQRRSFVHDFYGEYFKIGIFGDTQFGSQYEAADELEEFYAFCRKEKVQALYHSGDVTDGNGVYPGHIRELRSDCITADAQAERAARSFVGAGLPVYFILGNHDLKWYRDVGFDVGAKIQDLVVKYGGKHPVKSLGHEQARVRLGKKNPCLLDLIHPGGGTPYAISYRPQGIVGGIEGGSKPHIIVVGHLHKVENLPHIRNVVAIQSGCFQWQTPFMMRKPTPAHVSACVLEGWMGRLKLRDQGANDRDWQGGPTLTRIREEWLKFYAPEQEVYDVEAAG